MHFIKTDDNTVTCVETGVQYWLQAGNTLHMQAPGQTNISNPDSGGVQFAKIVALCM